MKLISIMGRLVSFFIPSDLVPEGLRQGVYITNILSLIFSFLTFLLFYILFLLFGWSSTSPQIILVAISFLIIIPINRRFFNFGRLFFCLAPVYMTLFISVYGKQVEGYHSYITYFDSRYILLATTILPGVVFRLTERVKISVCLVSTSACLLLFDPIHDALGLGYYQRGFELTSYFYINYITFISLMVLLFGVLTLKVISEKSEQEAKNALNKLNHLNDQLLTRNVELTGLNLAIEAHNLEMQRQQEEIRESKNLLEEANRLISEQRERLLKSNQHLENVVKEKNADLVGMNEELIRHNNELRQFSYTISHNLRGPVARLMGLTNLFGKPESEDQKEMIISLIAKSGKELDEVLKDLSQIIDIRNDLYLVKEKISFEEEWQRALSMLQDQIRPGYLLEHDFSKAPYVYSIRAMIQSILYNLLSNAIKYRNPENILRIDVKTYELPNRNIVLMVSDNGLGMNIQNQREHIFKLYKRFHMHVDGKGLGLYLVKTQVTTLGGEIEVESEVNRGATFKISLPTPADASKQIFFESDAAQVYYDANINNTVIIWKKNITSEEYRAAFQTLLLTLRNYHTPGWIADLRQQGVVADEDQFWFMSNVFPEAVRSGLKRVAAVGFTDPIRKIYYERMIEKSTAAGITMKVFDSLEEAHVWMESFIIRD